MDIFGIGFPELVVIVIIALAVAGPERLGRWAYQAGKWFREIRSLWDESVGYIREEIEAAGPKPPSRHHMPHKLTSRAAPEGKISDAVAGEASNPSPPPDDGESDDKSPYDKWLPQ